MTWWMARYARRRGVAWRGVMIRPWVVVDVVGRVRVGVLLDGDLRV